ncbi:ATP-binding protein [Actinocorallia sp. API 0066]|uniref:ATP-binding protein n=1 Tax=Actinocorallia sp. API 0066 TaxID=2896846 RepID=UPI001E53B62F|nr:ATP-binding protein [Actinocorallia sp. API 0066]MCD0450544.1 ATP-binding protein [Actinocorallia sp. API 0066]
MTFDEGLVTAPSGTAERTFFTEAAQVAQARSWVRATLPESCAARDDYLVVVSELLGNCVVHALPGDATLSVRHAEGVVSGTLVHRMPPSGHVAFTQPTLTEIRHLAESTTPPDPFDLAESGRGLPLVVLLCQGSVLVEEHPTRTITHWTVPGCLCP